MLAATVTRPRLARAPGTDRWRWSGGGAGVGAGHSSGAGAASSMSGLPGLVVVVVGTSSCMSSLVSTWPHTVASSGGHKGH